jgi:subfamily B ATP-binding cassette protein MsbA
LNPFVRLDKRLLADLYRQRRIIRAGLLCVLITSLLDGLTIPLIERSVNSIQQAAPRQLSEREQSRVIAKQNTDRAAQLAKPLNLEPKLLESALNRVSADQLNPEIEATRLRDALRKEARARLDQAKGSSTQASQTYVKVTRIPVSELRTALDSTKNRASGNIDAVTQLGLYSLLVIVVFTLKYWFTRGQALYLSRAAIQLAGELRVRLYEKLQRLPVSYFGERRVGSIQSVLTNDVNVYQSAVGAVRDSIDGPLRAIIAFAYIIIAQWQLALITLLFLPAMAYVIQRNSKRMKAAQAAVQHDLAELNATTTESIQGARVVKAFAAESTMAGRYQSLVQTSLSSQITAARRVAELRPMVELLGAMALAAVLYLCGWLSYYGQLQLGQIAALIYALDRINQGFRSVGNVSNTYSQVQAASDRIYGEILDAPEADLAATGGATVANPTGRIEFENVSFSYPDGTEALSNVSFTLEPGTSLALVGTSGAGKSTIADLILRFYDPTSGTVRFDGQDLRDLDLDWYRRQIGVVPQHTFLFAGTVAENLRLGQPEASDQALWDALKLAHADDFVRNAGGLEFDLGEGGIRLSGGQRQRLAIARALLRNPKLLLLDEATSALDAESERAVTDALNEVMKQTTTLFIAHRLTTAARADQILVMSKGVISETGSHAELMANNSVYAGLFRAFSGGMLA